MPANFQTDNKKYTNKSSRVNVNNPEFNNPVKLVSDEEIGAIKQHIKKWKEFIAFYRWYPDLWYDLIKPESGRTIRLGHDQRVILRCLARFKSTYGVLTRGFGKTMLAYMNAVHTSVFYPGVQVALTAQTRENSAKLIKDKHDELIACFPLLKEEIYNVKFSKDTAEIEFHNGSKITNLANNQSSKGAHVQRGIVDEDNLTNEEVYQDVLEPIFTTVPRMTCGRRGLVDPWEMNGQISQLTSAGFRGSSAFFRCLKHLHNMVECKGEICIGAGWELACHYGRGATKSEILKKQQTLSSIAFDMNYRGVWTGVADNALVSMNKLMDCRSLTEAEEKGKEDGEYVIGIDIARSDKASNNQTSVAIMRVIRTPKGKIKEVWLVNMQTMEGTLDFEAQACEIKKIVKRYNVVAIVSDDNGLSKGTVDALVKISYDATTGENLGCYGTMNSERVPDEADAPKLIFCYLAQKYDNESIPTLIDAIETGKLRLLEKKDITAYTMSDETFADSVMPFFQTNCFVEEVSNLKLEHLNNNGFRLKQVSKKVNKDRVSSVQYALWYIMKFLDNKITEDDEGDIEFLAQYISW